MAEADGPEHWWWYVEDLASLAKQAQSTPSSLASSPTSTSPCPEELERAVARVLGERGRWAPFSPIDRARLETALCTEERQMACSGHSGQRLWLADLSRMEMSPMYWKGGSVVPLRRALWYIMGSGGAEEEDATGGVPCPAGWEAELEAVFAEHSPWLQHSVEGDAGLPGELMVQLGGPLANWMLQLRRGVGTMATLVPEATTQLSPRGLMKGILPSSPPRPIRLIRGYSAYYGAVITAINNPDRLSSKGSPPVSGTPPSTKLPTASLPSPFEPVPESLTPPPVKHVIFVVHGIGQKLAEKVGYGFVASVNSLRRYVLESGQSLQLGLEDVYILPIQWRVDLEMGGGYFPSAGPVDSPEHEFDSLLSSITLPSVPAVRTLATDVTMDVLLYMTPRHFNRIIEACVKELRRAHELFVRWNPGSEAKISVIGHSLGSALMADILGISLEREQASGEEVLAGLEAAEARLGFPVENFFCFGSPLPLFMMLRHVKPIACARHPALPALIASAKERFASYQAESHPKMGFFACRQLYNLFMPYDPVAYRLEPLIVPPAERRPVLEPVAIPYYKGGLTGFKIGMAESLTRTKQDVLEAMNRSLPQWFREKIGSAAADPSALPPVAAQETEAMRLLKAFNASGRLDYVLQDSLLENAYLSSVSSHFSYWSDQDVAAFLLSQLFKCLL